MKKTLSDAILMFTRYFLIGFLVQLVAFNTLFGRNVTAQLNETIAGDFHATSVEELFSLINKKTALTFVYDSHDIDGNAVVHIRSREITVGNMLDSLSKKLNWSFRKIGNTITVKKGSHASGKEAYELPVISFKRLSRPLVNNHVAPPSKLQSGVSGIVTDSSGNPLIGVTVQVKGSKVGTTTNAEGHYTIDASASDTLVFSYVGYASREVAVGTEEEINVVLQESSSGLNEVVVVAYGETKKRDINSAISTLPMDNVAPIPVQSINDAVGGRIPGVIVTADNGGPGAKSQISIRGGSAPLFVIDGMIRSQNDFENLDPNDIESYSVLKDAAATSLYGALGGNGVILVTTKKGKAGQTRIDYSFNQIFSQPTVFEQKLSSYDHLNAINQVYLAEGKEPPTPDSILQYYKDQSKPYEYPNTDWQKLTLRKFAPEQRHDLSITSGTEKLTYYASGSYYHQGTILKTDHNYNNRVTYRLNTVSNFDNIGLKVTTGLDGYVEKNEIPNSSTASSYFHIYSHIQNKGSQQQAYNNLGLPSANTTDNPVIELSPLSGYLRNTNRVFNSILGLDWEVPFLKDLHLKANGSYNMGNSSSKSWNVTAPSYANNSTTPILGNPPSLTETSANSNTFILQGFVTYNHSFRDHHIDFTGVYEQRQDKSNNLSATRQQYQILFDQFVAGPTVNQLANGAEYERASASYLGRLSYNYKSRYFLDLTMRYDGLDLFPTGKQWGSFYAASAGWILSDESFMQSLKEEHIFDYLKLRASYGLTGTADGIIDQPLAANPFLYVPGYSVNANAWVVDGQPVQGTSEPGTLPSTNFSWYSIRSRDFGFDFGTLNNKLSGAFDYYYNRTTGYVASDTRYAAILGIGLPPINDKDAALRKEGVDFDISWNDKIGSFTYKIGFNYTYFNQLWERTPDEDEASLKNPYTRSSGTTDADFGTGYINDGLYQNNSDLLQGPRMTSSTNVVAGDLRYEDTNGDGKIDGSDQRRIGSSTFPRSNYGLTLDLGFKGLYLNAVIMGSGQRDRYLGDVIQGASGQGSLIYAFQENYWTPDNTGALFPRAVSTAGVNGNNNFVSSDFWLLRSSYVRLKYLQIGYDLKDRLLKNTVFRDFKVFISGTNLLTKAKSLDYFIDPESDPNNYNYPIQRTFAVGLNVGF